MFFMGLLKNLGKMVLVNIIKDIGKEALKVNSHKSNTNFNEILKANFDIAPKKTSNNQEDLKKVVIKKLKDLELKIIKKNLPEDIKNKIIKKIDELIDIISKEIVNIKISEDDKESIKVTLKIDNKKKDILISKDKNEKEDNEITLYNKLTSLIKEINNFIKKNNINEKITLNIINDKNGNKIKNEQVHYNSKLLNFNSKKIEVGIKNSQKTSSQSIINEKPIIQNQFSNLNINNHENSKNTLPILNILKNKNFSEKNNSNLNKISHENSKINILEDIFAKTIKEPGNINKKGEKYEVTFNSKKISAASKASNHLDEINLVFNKIKEFSNRNSNNTKIDVKELLNKIINSKNVKEVKITQNNFNNDEGTKDNLEKNLKHNNLIKKNIETVLAKRVNIKDSHIKEEITNFNDKNYKKEEIQNFQFINDFKKSQNIKDNKFAEVKDLGNKSNLQENIISQIKKVLQNNINLKSEISIKLNPPELGKIHLKLVMVNNDLSAKITTENSIVKNVIVHNLNQLQETLMEKGINLSNFNVTVQGEFADNHSNQQKFEKKYFNSNFGEFVDNSSENNEIHEFINEINNTLNLKV